MRLAMGLGLSHGRRRATLAISGTPILVATEGEAYDGFTVSATGGTAPYTFSVASGDLPDGITLDANTGAVAGTPTESGAFAGIVIRVTDAALATDDLAAFTIEVEAASDPLFANVVLLCGFDGADGSTTFTDESSHGRTLTANGNAQVDTAQQKFGTGSLLCDGTGDFLSTPDATELKLGTGDFCIEAWIRLNATGRVHTISNKRNATGFEEHTFQVAAANTLLFALGNSSPVVNLVGGTALTTGVWYHVAASREGSLCRLFLDGTLETSANQSGAPNTNSSALLIGRDGSNSGRDMLGWIDEYRFTKGAARYTADFTPPTQAFPRE